MSSACQRRFSSTTAVRMGPGVPASASSCVEDRVGLGGLALAVLHGTRGAASRAGPRRGPCSGPHRRARAGLRASGRIRRPRAASPRGRRRAPARPGGASSRMPAMAARRRSASCAWRATSARIASVQAGRFEESRGARRASGVPESAPPSAVARAARTPASDSLSHAAASGGEIGAAPGGRGAHLGRRVGGDEGGELGRIRRQLRHAEDALRRPRDAREGGMREKSLVTMVGNGYRCGVGARGDRCACRDDNPWRGCVPGVALSTRSRAPLVPLRRQNQISG